MLSCSSLDLFVIFDAGRGTGTAIASSFPLLLLSVLSLSYQLLADTSDKPAIRDVDDADAILSQ